MKLNFMNSSRAVRVAFALLVCNTVITRADVEDRITKSFQVQPGGQFTVEVDRGSIDVKTADRDSVDIEVVRKAGGSDAEANAILKDHVVTTTQDGNQIRVQAEYKGPQSSGWFRRSPELQVKFIITVPRKFEANLQTAGGHINVAQLTGKLLARTSGGHLKFEQIEGPISAHTGGGSITIANCKGSVEANTSGGHLDLREIEGNVTAKTSGGSIRVDKITGKSVVKTSGGNIEAAGIKGSIEAGTSGGGISATLIEQPAGDCSFKTSGGSVTIVLGEKVAVDVDAHTSAGRVSTDLPVVSVIQGEQRKNELRGKINGGGPLITAHTSGGSVRFQKR
ncbi:MAG: DUF4097 domain-containing protein [Verrucomicrobia bacterium]|nr:DUF4097 domain-containing protein [Verrucomicrobiota bacterium]